MAQNTLEHTLQRVQHLSVGALHEVPMPETLDRAAQFISQVYDSLTGEGEPWQEPSVEVGGDGVVVFLWENGQHGLSVSVGPDGAGTWTCEPKAWDTEVVSPGFSAQVIRGTAGPAEFARDVWMRWARGQAPFA